MVGWLVGWLVFVPADFIELLYYSHVGFALVLQLLLVYLSPSLSFAFFEFSLFGAEIMVCFFRSLHQTCLRDIHWWWEQGANLWIARVEAISLYVFVRLVMFDVSI